jgi:hypothetical protein
MASEVYTPEDLLGIWSADAMYGPGGMSGQVLVFKPDGTGFLDESNGGAPIFAELFNWTVDHSNRLHIKAFQYFSLDVGDTIVVAPSDLDVWEPIHIAIEGTEAGTPMRVLRFEGRPWDGVSSRFGFVRTTTDGYDVPHIVRLAKPAGG